MLFFKKIRYLLLAIFFLIFSVVSYIAIDDNSRRSIFSKVLVLHDIYRIRSLTYGLQIRDFSLLSQKLNDYINFSSKFSEGKTYMFPGIYEATELVMSRAITQDDYNKIENVLEKLLSFDDRIYKLHVWYARAKSDDNYEAALKHIDLAIEISPADEDAYRVALDIAQNKKNFILANTYCQKYQQEFLGGSKPLHFPTIFDSFNNNRFSININNINNNDFNLINSNFILNKKKTYEFILNGPKDINGINIYFAPINNLNLKFYDIEYFSDGKIFSIKPQDLIVTSNHSYIFQEKNENFQVLLSKMKEELLSVRHKNLKNIEKINISFILTKMSLVNSGLCKIF